MSVFYVCNYNVCSVRVRTVFCLFSGIERMRLWILFYNMHAVADCTTQGNLANIDSNLQLSICYTNALHTSTN
jgi:hypothetical protein